MDFFKLHIFLALVVLLSLRLDLATSAKLMVSKFMADVMCDQKTMYDKTKKIEPPIKAKSKAAKAIQEMKPKCGWYVRNKCDAENCLPFTLEECEEDTEVRMIGMKGSQVEDTKINEPIDPLSGADAHDESDMMSTTEHQALLENMGKDVKYATKKNPFAPIVQIRNKKNDLCSGVLIHTNWILTAAHCILSMLYSHYHLVAGNRIKNVTETSEQEFMAEEIIVHDDYNEHTMENDIALIGTDETFEFNEFVQPAKLPEPGQAIKGKLIFAGWVEPLNGDPPSGQMQSSIGATVSADQCKKFLVTSVMGETHFCAEPTNNRGCSDQSGGPVFFANEQNELVVAGINSWDTGCARIKRPTVYTNLSKFVTWMKNRVKRFLFSDLRQEEMAVRIVGGSEALPNKYTSLVLLKIDGSPQCAGTILNKDWVVTAAHCAVAKNPSSYTLVAGKHNMRAFEGPEQVTAVTTVIKHEGYSTNTENTKHHDIALMKVSPPFGFNAKVQPVNLVDPNYKASGMMWVAGWGKMDFQDAAHETPNFLQELDLPIIPMKICKAKLRKQNISADGNICAGYHEGGRDACQGDSGGPLYYVSSRQLYLVGVVSWGIGCAQKNKPGIYTNVANYIPWISNTIAQHKMKFGIGKRKSIVDDPLKDKYPSLLLLKFRGSTSCAATIISHEWALTAAHCLPSTRAADYQLIAAEYDTSSLTGEEQFFAIDGVLKHPEYQEETFANDIGLLRVKTKFKFSSTVLSANMPTPDYKAKVDLWIAGWPMIKNPSEEVLPTKLRHAKVSVVNLKKCRSILAKEEITENHICASLKEGEVDTRQGDSGGPLYDTRFGKMTVVGIVSWGVGGAKPGIPGVYTSINAYLVWIQRMVFTGDYEESFGKVFSGGWRGLVHGRGLSVQPVKPTTSEGMKTNITMFPSLVRIISNLKPVCTGTLIKSNFLITSAHCVNTHWPTKLQIVAGTDNPLHRSATTQRAEVKEILQHKQFTTIIFANDIAVLRIYPPFKINSHVATVNLPAADVPIAGKMASVGWGDDSSTQTFAGLQYFEVEGSEWETLPQLRFIHGKQNFGGRCYADPGSPLLILEKDKTPVIAGIASWPMDCQRNYGWSYFTNVRHYVRWIQLEIKASTKYMDVSSVIALGRSAAIHSTTSAVKPIQLSLEMSTHLCNQVSKSKKEHSILPPVKRKKGTVASALLKCGWFQWSRCDSNSGRDCSPFRFTSC